MKKQLKTPTGIDWGITVFPLIAIAALAVLLLAFPENAGAVIESMRSFLVNDIGFSYMLFGLAVVLISLYIACSRYGNIKLGGGEKPKHSTLSWGAMIFTSTMAADILYWALIEWAYYFNERPFAAENLTLAQKQDWSSIYPLFHWGPTAWGFYILPAAAYAYLLHVKKNPVQRMSEACRPILGQWVDRWPGKLVDVIAIVGLLAGTATTFSLATPLLSQALSEITGLPQSNILTIGILVLIAVVFTLAVLFGIKGISRLANICVVLFLCLVAIFFFGGPMQYIIESGVTGLGGVAQNFFSMSTWMDPLRLSSADGVNGFPQTWTIFYWAYWISWSVATPFFIAQISEGRTLRQTILGSYISGVSATFLAFIVFGNYGLFQQVTGKVDAAGMLAAGDAPATAILSIFETLPIPKVAMIVLILAMVAFYASTFDAITVVISDYCLKNRKASGEPPRKLRIFWSLVFIILPVALLFSESTLSMLQTLAICAALPIMIITGIIIAGFIRQLRRHKEGTPPEK